MKELSFLLLLALFVSCKNRDKDLKTQADMFLSPPIIDSTIRQMENVDWARASSQKDTHWFQSHIANELILTTGRTGEVTNKQQTIDEIKNPSYGSGSSDKLEDLKILSFENSAVATFKILTNGRDTTGYYTRIARYTEVWIYRDGRWQLWASHSSLLPNKKDEKTSHK